MWRLRATCTVVQAGLHLALPVSEAEMELWSLLVPECLFVRRGNRNLWKEFGFRAH